MLPLKPKKVIKILGLQRLRASLCRALASALTLLAKAASLIYSSAFCVIAEHALWKLDERIRVSPPPLGQRKKLTHYVRTVAR